MANPTLKDGLKNLEIIQESIKEYNRKESFDSQEESAFIDDIQRMLATTSDNLKSVMRENDLTKDVITDYVNKAADTQLSLVELMYKLYKIKKDA